MVTIQFEHPTMAGNQSGGWMERLKGHPSLTHPKISHPPSSPPRNLITVRSDDNTQDISAIHSVDTDRLSSPKPTFSMSEIRHHKTRSSAWIVVKNKVYDCTPYLKDHPGGDSSILIASGTDCTEDFEAVHSLNAWEILEDYYIGDVQLFNSVNNTEDGKLVEDSSTAVCAPVKAVVILKDRFLLCTNTYLFRFGFTAEEQTFLVPPGHHVFCYLKAMGGSMTMRAYTPISLDENPATVDFVIKLYRPSHEYPNGGKMSSLFEKLNIGDHVEMKGPVGHIRYEGDGHIIVREKSFHVDTIVMLCGGTGITPMFATLSAIIRSHDDPTQVRMIFANHSEDDIILKSHLDSIVREHPIKVQIYYLLSKPNNALTWMATESFIGQNHVGYMNSTIVTSLLNENLHCSIALICGPPGFKQTCYRVLLAQGFEAENISEF
jgi:nitrate reductase (NAD(P)H)